MLLSNGIPFLQSMNFGKREGTIGILHGFCLCMCRMAEDGLTEEECMRVYPLVFAAHRGLASAAGVFLYHV